jgi:hypothetical protein
MRLRSIFFAGLLALAAPPARAEAGCEAGQLCTLGSEQFGCKELPPLKRWVDLYVETSRVAADRYMDREIESGACARFRKGDQLRILRYVGMRRVEVQREGESQRFILLLK